MTGTSSTGGWHRRQASPRDNNSDLPLVIYLVKRVERGVRAALDEGLREFGLTAPQYTTLSVLRSTSGLSSAQLARRSFVSPQAMNEIVVGLERRGLLARTPNPERRRVLAAVLTADGEQLLAKCEQRVAEIEATVLGAFSPDAVETLRGLLEQCATALEEAHRARRAVKRRDGLTRSDEPAGQ